MTCACCGRRIVVSVVLSDETGEWRVGACCWTTPKTASPRGGSQLAKGLATHGEVKFEAAR